MTLAPAKFNIPFSRVDCSGNELDYVAKVLQSGWLTTGKMAQALETRFRTETGARHALAVSSCTAALHLALDAAGVKAGDKVLVPTMTFASTVEVICYLNAIPILMDVDPDTSAVNETIVADAIRKHPDVKAMMVVHYGGQAVPLTGTNGIQAQCRAAGITLVEDAAHAFPAREGGQSVGGHGNLTCFSFYANKTITTGEGGMVTCQSDELAERMSCMRLHGINRDVWARYTDTGDVGKWEYDVVAAGYKYNLADLNAAVGIAQMERADEMRTGRQRVAQAYREGFSADSGLQPLVSRVPDEWHSWHLFPIRLATGNLDDRNAFIDAMAAAGIGTSVHYKPVHRLSYYRNLLGVTPDEFPGAEALWLSTVSLPIYHTLSDSEVDYVIRCALSNVAPSKITTPRISASVSTSTSNCDQ